MVSASITGLLPATVTFDLINGTPHAAELVGFWRRKDNGISRDQILSFANRNIKSAVWNEQSGRQIITLDALSAPVDEIFSVLVSAPNVIEVEDRLGFQMTSGAGSLIFEKYISGQARFNAMHVLNVFSLSGGQWAYKLCEESSLSGLSVLIDRLAPQPSM